MRGGSAASRDDARRVEHELVVRRAERRRDQPRVLVLGRTIVEPDGVGVEPRRAGVDGSRQDRRRIDAARQKHADRHVGDQVRRHAVLHRAAQRAAASRFGAARERALAYTAGHVRERRCRLRAVVAPSASMCPASGFRRRPPRSATAARCPTPGIPGRRPDRCGARPVPSRDQRVNLRRERDRAGRSPRHTAA